jgi:2-oxoglutarate ferredoxin oxidoreductase subunit alpha
MNKKTFNIMIGGEAGQGLVTIGDLLAKALVRSSYSVSVTQSYQSRIRGGHNTYAIRFGAEKVEAPEPEIDLLVALNAETVQIHKDKVAKGGLVLAGAETGKATAAGVRAIPFEELGSQRQVNTVALGVAACALGLDQRLVEELINARLARKKGAEAARENAKVIGKAFTWASEQEVTLDVPARNERAEDRLMMNGNDAIALGAISAGLKFYAFYPMTPSTSVGLGVIRHADAMGIFVEQAEDEIAAINMAIGASFAGAPSMVATSGGGFALMVEGVSLAAMTETPLVIVVGQRPGPATGLPTRTEQADLDFVLHAGHGEFPRAIFAPGTVEECFHLTRIAFETAERFQSPVFVLTDQYLADSLRDVNPADLGDVRRVLRGTPDPSGGDYLRFRFTAEGISPRLLPGLSEALVIADSDEHDEKGHITENLSIRKKMVEKRLAKFEGMRSEAMPPERIGDDDPEIILACWGSTKGAVVEAVNALRARSRKCAALFFPQVWPLPAGDFREWLGSAPRTIMVEGNAFGQFARLLRRETGFEFSGSIRRYDGLPITPEDILNRLEA